MSPNHPFIAFLVARDSNGRFEQISNRSYVKHPFASTNSSGCGTCISPGTSQLLGVNCSDTYGASLNGSYTYLGPPDEIDPWLGTWDPVCSYFDAGAPPVGPPQNCDGIKNSITYASSTAPPRCNVKDADLNVPGATYWAQAGWLTKGELEANRGNNFATRRFIPTWGGTNWNLAVQGSLVPGSILQHWTGASLSSATNTIGSTNHDGRVFVAVKVTGPVAGLYHYEYAVHNRDNAREISTFELPMCPGARILNTGFGDIDDDPSNDWTFTFSTLGVAWITSSNPLGWNAIYNFWFDSDAAPVTGSSVDLGQFLAGPGNPAVTVPTTAPLGLHNLFLGAGCGTPAPPTLYATGSPARATLGNATFGLASGGNAPGAIVAFYGGPFDGNQVLGPGCSIYVGGAPPNPLFHFGQLLANLSGVAALPAPVPNDPTLEGQHLNFVALEVAPSGGAYLGAFDLSDGLRVRIGDSIPGCP
jgi:hypothetical protein